MSELSPPPKPNLEDAGDGDGFKPTTEWDIARGYIVQFLIIVPFIFLLSYLMTVIPRRSGRYLHLSIGERICLAVGLGVIGVARSWWGAENSS